MIEINAAPLQGFTESAWRNAHSQVFGGIDRYYVPFIRLEKGSIRNKDRREVSLDRNNVQSLVPQIVAGETEEFTLLVGFLHGLGYRTVDLNMGCPFPLIANKGKGSGILPFPDKVESLLKAMEEFPDISFSVKMRLGWKEVSEWRDVLPLLNRSCVRSVTLHPRVGKQQYKGLVNKDEFHAFYEACELPLFYNGDLRTVSGIQELVEEFPRLKGVMLGRGLLADPSLAKAFREGKMSEAELKNKVAEMHELIYLYYRRIIEGGDSQLLAKLKTVWEYLLPNLDRKARKAILKSNRLDVYLKAVEDALR